MTPEAEKIRTVPKHIEVEIAELEKQLAEKKQELEDKKEVKHEKEIIKEIIKEKTETPAPSTIKPVASSQKAIVKTVKALKGEKKERQVQLLTDLAFQKGVIHATEVARNLDDPYILDEFHDTLVDELYQYLVQQGKLKQL